LQTLPTYRFQGLFTLFSKCLSSFLQYLFAIGLRAIFSVSCGTPADLLSTPKLSDSCPSRACRQRTHQPHRSVTLFGRRPIPGDLGQCSPLTRGDLTDTLTQAFTQALSQLHSSLFTRRYWENRCFFLFLRLVICLSSASRPYVAQVGIVDCRSTL